LSAGDGGATPAAALTGHTSPEHRAGVVLRAGFQFHVAKPVGMAELVDVVATSAAGRLSRGVDAAASTC
jgi:CheY-like chemotaxis protein